VKKYWSTHNICTKYIQNANITYDEQINKVCNQKIIGSYLPTYLGLPTYLPNDWIIYIYSIAFTTTNPIMGVVIFAMFWHSASSLPHHMLQPLSTTFEVPLLQMPCTHLCYAFSHDNQG
jgi:hypothetical protein